MRNASPSQPFIPSSQLHTAVSRDQAPVNHPDGPGNALQSAFAADAQVPRSPAALQPQVHATLPEPAMLPAMPPPQAAATAEPQLARGSKRAVPDSGLDDGMGNEAKRARPAPQAAIPLHVQPHSSVAIPVPEGGMPAEFANHPMQTVVQAWISMVADVPSSDGDRDLALLSTVIEQQHAIVSAVLAALGVDCNARDVDGNTYLLRAAMKGREAAVRALLVMPGVDVNARNASGNTALMQAADHGHAGVVSALLAAPGIDINARNDGGETALMLAASRGHKPIVVALLPKRNIEIEATDNKGLNALCRAAMHGHKAVGMRLFHAHNFDLEEFDSSDIYFQIWDSISGGNMTVFWALVETLGIDINAESGEDDGSIPLIAAAADFLLEDYMRALLAVPNIDVNIKDGDGRTPLTAAVKRGCIHKVLMLLAMPDIEVNGRMVNLFDRWADDYSDGYSDTALSLAVKEERTDIVEALLAMPKIDVNGVRGSVRSPLINAVQGKQGYNVRMLLAMPGVDKDYRDESGNTAQDIAKCSCPEVAQILAEHRVPSAQESLELLQLLETIFVTHAGNAQPAASGSSSAASEIPLSIAEADMLNALCARLQFGECETAEVPALLRSIEHLPQSAKHAAALAVTFGLVTGHFTDGAGVLDPEIVRALTDIGLFVSIIAPLHMLNDAMRCINLYRHDGMNLLCAAAGKGNLAMIRGLVRMGAYVNLPSPNGDTALATAVAKGQWAACTELIFFGALPTLPDRSGYPMIYHLAQAFCTSTENVGALALLIRYLIRKGVRFDIPVRLRAMKEKPDATGNADSGDARSRVFVSELLLANPERWAKFGSLILGLDALPAAAMPGMPPPGSASVAAAADDDAGGMDVDVAPLPGNRVVTAIPH